MKNTTMILMLLAMTCLWAGAGEAKNDTPKAVLATMVKSMVEGDADTYVSIFDATEGEAKILRALGNYSTTALGFEKAMIEAYGEEGIIDKKMNVNAMLDGTWHEKVKIKIDGDKAIASPEGKDKPIKLVKKEGSWKIAADAMIASSVKLGNKPIDLSQDVDKTIKMFQAMADAYTKVMPAIGKRDMTAADIKQGLGQLVMRALFERIAPESGE